jgi:predicted dehydrogenase
MIRIGIMSFAHMHAHSYAACLAKIPDAKLAAIWDDKPARGRRAARENGVPFVKTLDEFLGSGLEGVIVCSENATHRPHVEAAARAGLWILCEKPIATTASDARAMISACARARVGFGIAFPCRFATPLLHTRDRVRAGEIGRLLAAACTNNGQFPGGWFGDPGQSGGGAVMDHTVHVADALRWITGSEFTRVYCACANLIHDGMGTDDIGSLQLEMKNGALVTHVASWDRPESFPTWGDLTLDLTGTKGSLRVDAFRQKIDVYSDALGKGAWAGWGDDANLGLVRDFVAAIGEGRDPAATGTDGLRALEVTLAAYRSAQSGKPVAI